MLLFAIAGVVGAGIAAGPPWDKAPEQWTLADVFRILQDSPWSPSKVSLESNYTQRTTNSQSGIVDDSPVNGRNTAVVPGVTLTRGHPLPPVTVLWWSSKTIRLAEAKRIQARAGAQDAVGKVDLNPLPDYVLTVEGDEPLRILRDAREDLHETVFLELENGGVLDLASVQYVEDGDSDVVRSEMHFARLLNGEPAIDPESAKVIFHCRANAKKEMQNRENALSFRVEFSPRLMKVRGQPDF
ncbi:MAG TPA: hypothetical protein VM781_01005 [Candidatus Bathyarchaeia archaeon]|nr:hypothetical protein [Candidatus Bathyarchaeia archaeon]